MAILTFVIPPYILSLTDQKMQHIRKDQIHAMDMVRVAMVLRTSKPIPEDEAKVAQQFNKDMKVKYTEYLRTILYSASPKGLFFNRMYKEYNNMTKRRAVTITVDTVSLL